MPGEGNEEMTVSMRERGYSLGQDASPLTDRTLRHQLHGNTKKTPATVALTDSLTSGYIEGLMVLISSTGISLPELGIEERLSHVVLEHSGRHGIVDGINRVMPAIPQEEPRDKGNTNTAHYLDGYTTGWAAKIAKAEKRRPEKYEIPRSADQYKIWKEAGEGNFAEWAKLDVGALREQEKALRAEGYPQRGEQIREIDEIKRKLGLLRTGITAWLRSKDLPYDANTSEMVLNMPANAKIVFSAIISNKPYDISTLEPDGGFFVGGVPDVIKEKQKEEAQKRLGKLEIFARRLKASGGQSSSSVPN